MPKNYGHVLLSPTHSSNLVINWDDLEAKEFPDLRTLTIRNCITKKFAFPNAETETNMQ